MSSRKYKIISRVLSVTFVLVAVVIFNITSATIKDMSRSHNGGRVSQTHKNKKDKSHENISTGSGSYSGYYYYGSGINLDSYDQGYEDVLDNEDYDWDRYERDDDYAMGVDDALDELGL